MKNVNTEAVLKTGTSRTDVFSYRGEFEVFHEVCKLRSESVGTKILIFFSLGSPKLATKKKKRNCGCQGRGLILTSTSGRDFFFCVHVPTKIFVFVHRCKMGRLCTPEPDVHSPLEKKKGKRTAACSVKPAPHGCTGLRSTRAPSF